MDPLLTAPIVFDSLEPITVPVTLGKEEFILKEAPESVAVQFQNARIAAARFANDELNSVQGAAEVEPLLVGGCLFRVVNGSDGKKPSQAPVGTPFVKQLPARIVKPLYERALEISHLDDGGTLESIDKQIASLQKRRAKLVKGAQEDSFPKESQDSTGNSSV